MIRTTAGGGCYVGPTGETLRVQAKCFLICGIVFFVIGMALIVVAATTTTFIFGVAVVLAVWGVICFFVSWRKFQVAKLLDEGGTGGLGPTTMVANVTQINHPSTTVYQHPQQGFAPMPATQFSNAAVGNQYSSACPPYPTHGLYPTQGAPDSAPPSYDDVTKKQ